jgi:hypothetical protein
MRVAPLLQHTSSTLQPSAANHVISHKALVRPSGTLLQHMGTHLHALVAVDTPKPCFVWLRVTV